MTWTRKTSGAGRKVFRGKHAVEHWFRDNQIYISHRPLSCAICRF
ncbi:MAG: hypothetical protein WC058_13810 [Phycisphaeraceae bacterium]